MVHLVQIFCVICKKKYEVGLSARLEPREQHNHVGSLMTKITSAATHGVVAQITIQVGMVLGLIRFKVC
jgi:hypothetical protein